MCDICPLIGPATVVVQAAPSNVQLYITWAMGEVAKRLGR